MKQWKRIAVVVLAVILAAALAGCGSSSSESAGSSSSGSSQSSASGNNSKSSTEKAGGKVLVIYFSRTGEQYGVGVIHKGNTAIVADMIADATGGDLFEVKPADDHYPKSYDKLTDVAKKEQSENARPAYAGKLPDLSKYDTIFIGAPVWWGDWPMIMYTVFDKNDFSGKKLVPFSTSAGSGLSGFDKSLAKEEPKAMILEGQSFLGTDCQNDKAAVRKSVKSWLSDLGF